MALQLGPLRDELEAAEEVTGYENRLAKVEGDLTLLKWMVGTTIALTPLVLGKQFGMLG